MPPKVSVILPTYNSSKYIVGAVGSVLNQSYTDFELIIIDDCSTDNTAQLINDIRDSRITFVRNKQNSGRAASDNLAINLASGEYIAKMDSDDICHPERLERQTAILQKLPNINVVGSLMQNFGHSKYLNKYPEHANQARCQTLFTLPVGNPSIMLRSSLFKKHKFYYNETFRQSEDYEFFGRYIQEITIYNIQKALINYRTYKDEDKESILKQRRESAVIVQKSILQNWGIDPTSDDLAIHQFIAFGGNLLVNRETFEKSFKWLEKMLLFNKKRSLFNTEDLNFFLSQKWFETCYNNPSKGFDNIFIFNQYNGKLGVKINPSLFFKTKFLIKNII